MTDEDMEDAWDEDVGWVVVRDGEQRLAHVVPALDVVRHRVLLDAPPPLRLCDGVVVSCLCGPLVRERSDGTTVVLHCALDERDRTPPPEV